MHRPLGNNKALRLLEVLQEGRLSRRQRSAWSWLIDGSSQQQVGPLSCSALGVDGSWFGYLAQTEKARTVRRSGSVAPLPAIAPPATHRIPGSTFTPPLINSRPPLRIKFGVSLQGAMWRSLSGTARAHSGDFLCLSRCTARPVPASPLA